ncbi:MAG: hypothetical protein WBN36_11520, partial [Gammaproteobacteria bacterium]
ALNIARQCHTIAPDFLLADLLHVLVLAKQAITVKEYELAWMIVRNSSERYGDTIDTVRCALIEVELLWMHLGNTSEARKQMSNLLEQQQSEKNRAMILSLAKTLGSQE